MYYQVMIQLQLFTIVHNHNYNMQSNLVKAINVFENISSYIQQTAQEAAVAVNARVTNITGYVFFGLGKAHLGVRGGSSSRSSRRGHGSRLDARSRRCVDLK